MDALQRFPVCSVRIWLCLRAVLPSAARLPVLGGVSDPVLVSTTVLRLHPHSPQREQALN